MNIIIYLIIILFVFYVLNTFHKIERFSNYEVFPTNEVLEPIPKVIISTYYDKNKIPQKVFKNIKKYAYDYQYIVFDDSQIITFLKKYYPSNVLNTFHELDKGAHKADLFRYCYLYIYGGIYLDIKTELIEPIQKTFDKPYTNFYTVLSLHKPTIYQGIIASAPKNPIFLQLIDHIVNVKKPVKRYFEFTVDFYKKLRNYYNFYEFNNQFYLDENNSQNQYQLQSKKFNLYLFKEICSKKSEDCCDGLDKYKLCCYVYDEKKKVIKTRYADYPWN